MYQFDAERIKNECVRWIRDFFEQNGKGCNAVVGISGGKDSSVVAALCVEALGKDRVIGVLRRGGRTYGKHSLHTERAEPRQPAAEDPYVHALRCFAVT